MHTTPFCRLAAAASVVALLALTGCANTADSADGEVTVLYAAIAYEPLFIAKEQGFFADHGLTVTLTPGGAPQDNLAQAVGGSAQITAAAWDTMVKSTAEHVPVSVLASNSIVSDTVDTSGVVVRENSGITSLAQLAGKTVGFDSIGAGGTAEFSAALVAAGLSPDDVTIVATPYASMQASLEAGHIDAAFPSDPFYSTMAKTAGNAVIANPVRETRAGVPATLWAATNDWLQQHAKQAEEFVAALDEAMAFYADPANTDAVLKIRSEVSDQPLEQVSRVLPPMSTSVDMAACGAAIDQLVSIGLVADPLPVDEIVWQQAPRK